MAVVVWAEEEHEPVGDDVGDEKGAGVSDECRANVEGRRMSRAAEISYTYNLVVGGGCGRVAPDGAVAVVVWAEEEHEPVGDDVGDEKGAGVSDECRATVEGRKMSRAAEISYTYVSVVGAGVGVGHSPTFPNPTVLISMLLYKLTPCFA